MKKFLMLTAFSAALLMTACGGRTDSSTTDSGRDDHSSNVADDAGKLFSDVADGGKEAASDIVQGGKEIASDVADGAKDMFDGEDGTEDGSYRTDEDGNVKST